MCNLYEVVCDSRFNTGLGGKSGVGEGSGCQDLISKCLLCELCNPCSCVNCSTPYTFLTLLSTPPPPSHSLLLPSLHPVFLLIPYLISTSFTSFLFPALLLLSSIPPSPPHSPPLPSSLPFPPPEWPPGVRQVVGGGGGGAHGGE